LTREELQEEIRQERLHEARAKEPVCEHCGAPLKIYYARATRLEPAEYSEECINDDCPGPCKVCGGQMHPITSEGGFIAEGPGETSWVCADFDCASHTNEVPF
jgi:hypothetical protein